MSNSEYVLEAVNLTKTFPGVKALDQVSLRVRPRNCACTEWRKRSRQIYAVEMYLWNLFPG